MCRTPLLTLLALTLIVVASTPLASAANADSLELARIVNDYRISRGLSAIPISKSLTIVAETHAKDSSENARPNNGDSTNPCNLHSWSAAATGTACCYTSDHKNTGCMNGKPQELTTYPGIGLENSAMSSRMSPAQALSQWKGSSGHHRVIINEAPFTRQFKAMGAGIHGRYANLWFGYEDDPAGTYPQVAGGTGGADAGGDAGGAAGGSDEDAAAGDGAAGNGSAQGATSGGNGNAAAAPAVGGRLMAAVATGVVMLATGCLL